MSEFTLLIGDDRVAGANGTYEIVNPATEEVVAEAPDAGVQDAEDAARAAAEAFPSWSQTDPEERAALLDRTADLLEARADELFPLVQAETGATWQVTTSLQVPQAVLRMRRYAKGALEPSVVPIPPGIQETTPLAPGGVIGAQAIRQPVGVVVCITSYNFPMTNMAGKIGPALAMGNTVVVKPAPQDPLQVIRMVELMREAGFPPGVVNVVVAEGSEAAEALVASDDVDMVSFTGSTAVGERIGAVAGGRIKRQLLELGGKGASIIFDDADLQPAIQGTGSTWAFHSGQICTAPTRVLAQRGVHDQVVEGLATFAGYLAIGDPLAEDTVVGPVITDQHRARVEGYVEAGRSDGAEVVTGGERPDMEKGWYVAPTLLAGCSTDMSVVQDEIFGPVLSVVPFEDEDEAVELANGTSYGLYDYVWTADGARAMEVARRLRTGNVGLNTLQRNHETPFGGFKKSGVGRDGGSFGLHAYSDLQAIVWST